MAEKIASLVEHAAEHRHGIYQTFTSIGLHFAVAFSVTLALTGQAIMSGAVALIEPVVCHFAHLAHDWAWGLFGHGHAETSAASQNPLAAA